jgi:hypothetical protein
MNESLLTFVSSACINLAYIYWKQWCTYEKKVIKEKTLKFLINGCILVKSVTPQEKLNVWKDVLYEQLLKHWKSINNSFRIDEKVSWPKAVNGRSYEYCFKNADNENTPKLISSNYEVQAVIACLFDSSFINVSYGHRSHWKLLFLVSPLKSFFRIFVPSEVYRFICDLLFFNENELILTFDDHGWNLVNFPNPEYGAVGTPLVDNAHIDSGENFENEILLF